MGKRDAKVLELTIELERALLGELTLEWSRLNASYFKRSLAPPVFVLGEGTSRLGRFSLQERTLEMSRELLLKQSWGVVVEVLKHEMAHQYVLEVLKVEGEAPHGPTFSALCSRLGIDARATGLPSVERTSEADRVLDRIAKLLALASSPSEHEAQAAMSAAQRLMLKYNLETAGSRAYAFRHLGKPTGRVTEAERLIGVVLSEHFFVEAIWVPVYRALEGKRGSVLEVCGTDANLEIASYVYDFLLRSAAGLWDEHKKRAGITKNRDRRTFLAGVMHGFLARLAAHAREQRTAGLVWVKDADLHGFYRARHPHIVHARFAGEHRNDAHMQGREAGKKLVLHKPVKGGPSGAVRLLTRGD